MRREERREAARHAARRAGMQAARAAARRHGHSLGRPVDERHPFPCAFACADCLVLSWPTDLSLAGDPMRTDRSDSRRPTHPCPRCGDTNWVDLSIPKHAEALLEDLDTQQRRVRTARTRMRAAAVVGLLYIPFALSWCRVTEECMAGMLSGALPARCNVEVNWGIVALGAFIATWVLASLAGYVLARRAPAGLRYGSGGEGGRTLFSGTIEGTDVLRAPLTGQPCVAYQIEVRREGSALRWLVERRCEGAAVAGLQLGPDAAVDFTSVGKTARRLKPEDTALTRWLTERGIDPHGATWHITEATLRTGELARLRQRGATLVLAAAQR